MIHPPFNIIIKYEKITVMQRKWESLFSYNSLKKWRNSLSNLSILSIYFFKTFINYEYPVLSSCLLNRTFYNDRRCINFDCCRYPWKLSLIYIHTIQEQSQRMSWCNRIIIGYKLKGIGVPVLRIDFFF